MLSAEPCAVCQSHDAPLLACENGSLYHPFCYFAEMQARGQVVQLPLFAEWDRLWPKPRGRRRKKLVPQRDPWPRCVRCADEIYDTIPVETLTREGTAAYYHMPCYRDAHLEVGLPDPFPHKEQPKQRRGRRHPPIVCVVCGEAVARLLFSAHARSHARAAGIQVTRDITPMRLLERVMEVKKHERPERREDV